MVRYFGHDVDFYVVVYASHDCSLIAWNFLHVPSESVFVGVRIERDGKVIEDNVKGRFSFGDYTLSGVVTYRISSVNAEGKVTRSVVLEKVGIADAFALPHAVFFNRGCAGSQRFAKGVKSAEFDQLEWLGKGLDKAMLKFVRLARDERDALLVMAYELTLIPFLEELKLAYKRGVRIQVLFDCKTSSGKLKDTSQDAENALAAVQFPKECLFRRTKMSSAISHNKFMVLIVEGVATKVWTGSTNYTLGGVYGQLNAAHLISDVVLAKKFAQYFEMVKLDPAPADLRSKLDAFSPVPKSLMAKETIVVFSPQSKTSLLLLQSALVQNARESVFMTAAFGINSLLQKNLKANEKDVFLLVEQSLDEDMMTTLKDRVSVGCMLEKQTADRLELETEQLSGLNNHIKFVHTKILLCDMFSNDCICVFGSGNFSEASVTKNDENQIICRGDVDLADQILVHLFRLFYHFRWRKTVSDNLPEVNFLAKPRPNNWFVVHFEPNSEKAKTRNLMCKIDRKDEICHVLNFELDVANQEPIKISRPKKGGNVGNVGNVIKAIGEEGFEVTFKYDAGMVQSLKEMIIPDDRLWNPESKVWKVKASSKDQLLKFAEKYKFSVEFF